MKNEEKLKLLDVTFKLSMNILSSKKLCLMLQMQTLISCGFFIFSTLEEDIFGHWIHLMIWNLDQKMLQSYSVITFNFLMLAMG